MAGAPPFASPQDAAFADRFFQGREYGAERFYAVARALRQRLGVTNPPLQLAATKSRVSLLARTRFAWCPQANLDGTITLRFNLPDPPDDERVITTVRDERMSHHVVLAPHENFDPWLIDLLAAAHDAAR